MYCTYIYIYDLLLTSRSTCSAELKNVIKFCLLFITVVQLISQAGAETGLF